MRSIYLSHPVPKGQLPYFQKEFHRYSVIDLPPSDAQWKNIEIYFGETFHHELLKKAPALQWIHLSHVPDPLLIKELSKKKELLVSVSKGSHTKSISEYLLASIFSVNKGFILTSDKLHFISQNIENQKILVIGDNLNTLAFAKRAASFKAQIWLLQEQKSFRPYFKKIFFFDNLHSILPTVDIVISAASYAERLPKLGVEEFKLFEKNALFIGINYLAHIHFDALCAAIEKHPLRKCVLDLPLKSELSQKLEKHPQCLVTYREALHPMYPSNKAFHMFRQNLRYYIQGSMDQINGILLFPKNL